MTTHRPIVTICGSYRFKDLMLDMYKALTDCGYIVLMPAIGCYNNGKIFYQEMHAEKILMSDLVFVVDGIEGYVGDDTKLEIEFALGNDIKVLRYSYWWQYKLYPVFKSEMLREMEAHECLKQEHAHSATSR